MRGRCPSEEDDNLEGRTCGGMMVLDRESHPNWKLCCNRCNKIIRFTTSIHDIQVLKSHCEECNASLVKVVFNKLNSPLPDGQLEYSGCIMCDDVLNGMIELISGRNKQVKSLFITVSDNITNVLERVQAFYERLGRTLT